MSVKLKQSVKDACLKLARRSKFNVSRNTSWDLDDGRKLLSVPTVYSVRCELPVYQKKAKSSLIGKYIEEYLEGYDMDEEASFARCYYF